MSDYIQCRKELVCEGIAYVKKCNIDESLIKQTNIIELNVKDQNITEYVLNKIQPSNFEGYLIYDNPIDVKEDDNGIYIILPKNSISEDINDMTNIVLYSEDSYVCSYVLNITESLNEYTLYVKNYFHNNYNFNKIVLWNVSNILQCSALYELDINTPIPPNFKVPIFLPPCTAYRSNRLDIQLESTQPNVEVVLISFETGNVVCDIPVLQDTLNVISLISNSRCDWLI